MSVQAASQQSCCNCANVSLALAVISAVAVAVAWGILRYTPPNNTVAFSICTGSEAVLMVTIAVLGVKQFSSPAPAPSEDVASQESIAIEVVPAPVVPEPVRRFKEETLPFNFNAIEVFARKYFSEGHYDARLARVQGTEYKDGDGASAWLSTSCSSISEGWNDSQENRQKNAEELKKEVDALFGGMRDVLEAARPEQLEDLPLWKELTVLQRYLKTNVLFVENGEIVRYLPEEEGGRRLEEFQGMIETAKINLGLLDGEEEEIDREFKTAVYFPALDQAQEICQVLAKVGGLAEIEGLDELFKQVKENMTERAMVIHALSAAIRQKGHSVDSAQTAQEKAQIILPRVEDVSSLTALIKRALESENLRAAELKLKGAKSTRDFEVLITSAQDILKHEAVDEGLRDLLFDRFQKTLRSEHCRKLHSMISDIETKVGAWTLNNLATENMIISGIQSDEDAFPMVKARADELFEESLGTPLKGILDKMARPIAVCLGNSEYRNRVLYALRESANAQELINALS